MFGRSWRSWVIRSARLESPSRVARWLSFTSTMSYKPKRWLPPPPASTAAFSKVRRPGVVFRVSKILTGLFPTASRNWRASVAMPQRRCRKVNATRSDLRLERVWPGTEGKLRARVRGVRQAIVDVCHKKGQSQVSNPSPHLRCSDQACQQQRLRACPTYRLGGGIRQKKKIQAAHAKEKQPI